MTVLSLLWWLLEVVANPPARDEMSGRAEPGPSNSDLNVLDLFDKRRLRMDGHFSRHIPTSTMTSFVHINFCALDHHSLILRCWLVDRWPPFSSYFISAMTSLMHHQFLGYYSSIVGSAGRPYS